MLARQLPVLRCWPLFTRLRSGMSCHAAGDCEWCSQTARQQFGAEQLAYIAAIAVGAALIHGDVPKKTTFRRLLAVPTLRELDEAYARQSWLNYRELLIGATRNLCGLYQLTLR